MRSSNAVHQWFWTYHHDDFPRNWYLTLSDTSTLWLALGIGVYTLYAGDRLWVLLKSWSFQGVHLSERYIVDSESPRRLGMTLPEDATSDGMELRAHVMEPDDPIPTHLARSIAIDLKTSDFSPKDAIQALWCSTFKHASDKPRVRLLMEECSARLLRKLGAWAMLVVLLTIGFAPFIPWLLTDFGRETPLVKSAYTKACGSSFHVLFPKLLVREAERQYLDCGIYPFGNSSHCRTAKFDAALPQLYQADRTCPFDPDLCVSDAVPISLHHRILPVDMGYNSPSRLALHHDLSCAPLALERFIAPVSRPGWYASILSFSDSTQELDTESFGHFVSFLQTHNGPNNLSSTFSGWDGLTSNPNYSMTMDYTLMPRDRHNHSLQNLFHPGLRSKDGSTFAILFNAGKTAFSALGPIKDPVFRSTRGYNNYKLDYLPDHEITALGCLEKYRFCFHGSTGRINRCSNWAGAYPEQFRSLYNSDVYPKTTNDAVLQEILEHLDLYSLYRNVFEKTSVLRFLDLNTKFIWVNHRKNGRRVQFISGPTQWRTEVRALFEAAFLSTRLHLFDIVVEQGQSSKDRSDYTYNDQDFCSAMLFLDSDYTNINGYGLVISFFGLSIPLVICLALKTRRTCHSWISRRRLDRSQDPQGGRDNSSWFFEISPYYWKMRAPFGFNPFEMLNLVRQLFAQRPLSTSTLASAQASTATS